MAEALENASLEVDHAAIMQYAALTDDYNPIHVDPEFAAQTPLGGVIAHGTMSLSLILQSLAATFGAQCAWSATVAVRFAKPVRVGDRVTAGGRPHAAADPALDVARYDVWVKNQHGDAVIEGHADVPLTETS